MAEVWKPIAGYPNYEVSDHGRVRHGDRILHGHVNAARGRTPGGYVSVGLRRDGQFKVHRVHRLVAAAFLGPSDQDVRHLNDVKGDNRVENLAYGNDSLNQHDSVRNGTHGQRSKTHCKHGHEFTPENTWWRSGPSGPKTLRMCITCAKARRAATYYGDHERTKARRRIGGDQYRPRKKTPA